MSSSGSGICFGQNPRGAIGTGPDWLTPGVLPTNSATASWFEWQLLLGLCRYAALRQGEALNPRWRNIDSANNRLRVISQEEWNAEDRDARVLPICPEFHDLLLAAFDGAEEGQQRVIPAGMITVKNISRDFGFLCRRAGADSPLRPRRCLPFAERDEVEGLQA
jgi:hypothetical protein